MGEGSWGGGGDPSLLEGRWLCSWDLLLSSLELGIAFHSAPRSSQASATSQSSGASSSGQRASSSSLGAWGRPHARLLFHTDYRTKGWGDCAGVMKKRLGSAAGS